ncbi:hypothetical protein AURDEDRAFT_164070 [Auricularia subglabra TFB-10046 SS5]|nr:hypothetical protein AURDEDRAFT_164070 [Auricularia subglabra TFB-10046 SS5]
MSDAFNEWLARAEQEKRMAAVQASYGLDAGAPSNRGAASSATQQLKFLNIIGDLDPRLVKPKAQQQQQAAPPPPKSSSRSPQRGGSGGQSLLTTALQEQKKSQAAQASRHTAQKK